MHKRPIGISILAVLQMIAGMVVAGLLLLVIITFDRISRFADAFQIPPAAFVISLSYYMGLTVVSGIGMWRGRSWGWWLGAFFYADTAVNAVYSLLILSGLDEGADGSSNADYRTLGFQVAAQMVVGSLLLLYFFRANILAFFKLGQLNRSKAVCMLIAAAIVVIGLFRTTWWFAQ